ncbi:MAG: DUF192 domain-containing protein [Thiobacillus sp.]|nr:DUF192 domain-containing protein [Thiobacillus sp.]
MPTSMPRSPWPYTCAMRSKPWFSVLAPAVMLASACGAQDNAPHTVRIGAHEFQVEIAATPDERQRGLMGRERLADNGGMLFVFEHAGRHCFWMRDTPLPLSIAFIDDAGRIVGFADMQPRTDTLHCPATAVRYALEIAQGGFARRRIASGTQVTGLR